MRQRLFTTGWVARTFNVPLRTVEQWMNDGILQFESNGKRHARRRLPFIEAEGFGVGRTVRQRGISRLGATAAIDVIRQLGIDGLESDFAAGRTHLLIIGDHAKPMLATPESLLNSEQIEFSAADELHIPWTIVDVKKIHNWLKSRAAAITQLPSDELASA